MKAPSFGIDKIVQTLGSKQSRGKNYALLCHPASIDKKLKHLLNLLDPKLKVKALFGPQHGIFGETQDNMIEWEDFEFPDGRPVYSLYGKTRIPTRESLKGVHAVIVDLMDVGARYYTFIYSLSYMMEVCADLGVEVIVCDRPNPLGGRMIEGPILDLEYQSFVGRFPIPVVHGMTIGELAKFFASRISKTLKLKVIPLQSWRRAQSFYDWKRPWILPSPNLPNFEACRLYPGMCLLEGTSLSEGRGTTRPFELIGAPFFNWNEIERHYQELCKKLSLKPVHFHRQGFVPTFHKFKGQLCYGALQIVPDSRDFLALRHAAVLIWVFRNLYGQAWDWNREPYEYEREKLAIDILSGDSTFREVIDAQSSLKDLFRKWADEEKEFSKQRREFLLY